MRSPVPTGTVLFVQITLYSLMFSPITFATDLTAVISDFPSFPSGVPTAMNIISESLIAFLIS